ncbi:MAG: hypothetical protein U0556_10965 [Dehalococcoidia bacterium]
MGRRGGRQCALLGFGIAGAVTAVTARDDDPDADVLIVEKMPKYAGSAEARLGPDARLSRGLEKWKIYQQALNQPEPDPRPASSEHGPTSRSASKTG